MATSPGPGAGKRGLRHLRELLGMLGVDVVAPEFSLPKGADAITAEGAFVTPDDQQRLESVLAVAA